MSDNRFLPNINDRQHGSHEECPVGSGKTARRVKICQETGQPLNASLSDADGDELDITPCGEVRITESSHKAGDTALRSIPGSATLANVTGTNMVNRKTILLQPIDGDILLGFSNTQMHHLITKENFFEVRAEANVNVWIRKDGGGGPIDVAISEIK